MNSPLLRTAGFATPARFVSSALKRACLLHRASRLSSCSGVSKSAPSSPCQYARRYATEAIQAIAVDGRKPRSAKTTPAKNSTKQHTPAAKQIELLQRLDPYLPLRLRSGSYIENLTAFEGVRDPASLPDVFLDVNNHFPDGVLSHIALSQYRWSAYLYLAEALIETIRSDSADISDILQRSPWSTVDTQFPDIQLHDGHINFAADEPLPGIQAHGPGFELLDPDFQNEQARLINDDSDQATALRDIVDSGSVSLHDLVLGHIWQSLGLITLRCPEFENEGEYGDHVMSHVYRVLATLHHEDKMHPDIYNFDSIHTPEASRKPALLHIMCSRILAVAAQAVWNARERDTIENYELMLRAGRTEAPGWQPRAVEPEAILELVLWSCVHGGHVDAATTVLQAMVKTTKVGPWSTISWPNLLQPDEGEEVMTSEELQDRLDQSIGEAYSPDPPLVSLPPRTISCEVVSAVIDQLGPTEKGPLALVNLLRKLRPLLSNATLSYSAVLFWNRTILQLLDVTDLPAGGRPSYTEAVGGVLLDDRSGSQVKATGEEPDIDSRALATGFPIEAVHLRAVSAFLSLGDLAGAVRSYGRLFLPSRQSTNKPTESQDITLALELPATTVGQFIDSIVKHKELEFARWMLYSDDAGRPVISEKHFASAMVQPDLIRLGLALGDNELVSKVAKHVQGTPRTISPAVLSALLHAQTSLRNFKNAEAVLILMRDRGIVASDRDVFVLACAILELQALEATSTSQTQLKQASDLLEGVLGRKYAAAHQPYQEPDHVFRRRMAQLTMMIGSLGNRLASVARKIVPVSEASHPIATDDFNMLLEAVVKAHGPIFARSIYNRWCKLARPEAVSESAFSTDSHVPLVSNVNIQPNPTDACVEASARTVHIILEPIVERVSGSKKAKSRSRPPSAFAVTDQHARDDALSEQGPGEDAEAGNGEAVSECLEVKRDLPLPPGLEVPILNWGSRTLQDMGWTTEAIMRQYPGIYEMR